MELKDLIGLHKLSAVGFETQFVKHEYRGAENANVVNFVLDGKTYTAIEDPSDGYRSSMAEIKVSDTKLRNQFKPVKVLCIMRESRNGWKCDVLDMIDVVTTKTVLSVGTDNADDYYPSFVSDWQPQNMVINQAVKSVATDNKNE